MCYTCYFLLLAPIPQQLAKLINNSEVSMGGITTIINKVKYIGIASLTIAILSVIILTLFLLIHHQILTLMLNQ